MVAILNPRAPATRFQVQLQEQVRFRSLKARYKRKQMEPAGVNESVHTGHKQQQRNCPQICMLASSVNWALGGGSSAHNDNTDDHNETRG